MLCLLAEGKSVKEAGAELFISHKTVTTYKLRLMEKMGMKTIAELTRYAVQNKLID